MHFLTYTQKLQQRFCTFHAQHATFVPKQAFKIMIVAVVHLVSRFAKHQNLVLHNVSTSHQRKEEHEYSNSMSCD